jgi:hypothetical protein
MQDASFSPAEERDASLAAGLAGLVEVRNFQAARTE